jgi:vitamin B12 transporter
MTSRDNTGLFIQHQATFGNHDIQLSLRSDDNEQFGTYTTGNAAWGYELSESLRLTASYGTAFKAPTFNDLYYPGYSNPNLRPAKSRSLEVGLAGGIDIGKWTVNVYETKLRDLIAYDSSIFLPNNIHQARIYGLEASLLAQLDDWDINTSLTLIDPRDTSGGSNDGNLLPHRAQQSLDIDVDRHFGKHRLGLNLHAENRRFDDLANTRRLAGYVILGLRGEYALAPDWRLQARIDNLLDKDYETVSYFNQPGRSLFVTLQYQP